MFITPNTQPPPLSPQAAADMDVASILATFPPDVREEILLTDESVLAALPPALLAEAQALRERSMRAMRGMPARPPTMQVPVAAEIRSFFQQRPQQGARAGARRAGEGAAARAQGAQGGGQQGRMGALDMLPMLEVPPMPQVGNWVVGFVGCEI